MKTIYREYNLSCDVCDAELRDFKNVHVLSSPKVRDAEALKVGFKVIKGKDVCPRCIEKMK